MLYEEFTALVGQDLSYFDWNKVDYVYTWSTLFDDCDNPKQKIADLFKIGGMELINHLYPAAMKECELSGKANILARDTEAMNAVLNAAQAFDEAKDYIENGQKISSIIWKCHEEWVEKVATVMTEVENLEAELGR